jgi:hypothetical protein
VKQKKDYFIFFFLFLQHRKKKIREERKRKNKIKYYMVKTVVQGPALVDAPVELCEISTFDNTSRRAVIKKKEKSVQ